MDMQQIPLSVFNASTEGNTLEPVMPGTLEYDLISAHFAGTRITIRGINRINNPALAARYLAKSHDDEMHGLRHQATLFHGTRASHADVIREGLDQRLSRVGFFGRGIHFAVSPEKACMYAAGKIFMASVLLGRVKWYAPGQHDQTMLREPAGFHSVMGNMTGHDEYVVYDNSRVLLEYEIDYDMSMTDLWDILLLGARNLWHNKNPGKPLPSHLQDVFFYRLWVIINKP